MKMKKFGPLIGIALLSLGIAQMRVMSPQEAAGEENKEAPAVYTAQSNSIAPA